jgi:uncharacterized protein
MPENKLPDVDDQATAPFWSGTQEGKIVVQSCTKCGYLRWPPGPICTECQSSDVEWKAISPTGTLWSHATYHRALDPAFAKEIPYTVGLIELDDGPRMYGRLVDGTANVGPGVPVRAVFREIGPRVTIIDWEIDKDRTQVAP